MASLQGKNPVKIKQQNLESLKRVLYRYAPLSRAEIAEKLELTPPTITNIVGELIQQGLVQELPEPAAGSHTVGRRPINLDFVAGSRLALGVSLGRDRTHYCITDLRGIVHAQGTFPLMSEQYEEMVQQMEQLLLELKSRHADLWQRLIGMGIAVPGIVNPHTGVIKKLDAERASWCDQPFGARMQATLHLPVRIENNVRARACAVSLFRPHLLGEETTFSFCHVSWGIACPILLGSHSFQGGYATAGEIGKMILDPSRLDPSGRSMAGCLEGLSSMRAVLEFCREALQNGECGPLAKLCDDPSSLTLEQVLEAQRQDDQAVCAVIDRAMFYLGIALANVVGFMNPHLIFLSGPIFHNFQNFDRVENTLHTYVFRSSDEKMQLIHLDMGEYGGAVGASAVCIEKYFLRG